MGLLLYEQKLFYENFSNLKKIRFLMTEFLL